MAVTSTRTCTPGPHRHPLRPRRSDADGRHEHRHRQAGAAHAHSRGLIDDSIKRSRQGVRAVALALLVLGLTAAARALVFSPRARQRLVAGAGADPLERPPNCTIPYSATAVVTILPSTVRTVPA